MVTTTLFLNSTDSNNPCIRYVSNLAPLSVMTNGRGGSAAGLTAAVTFDKVGNSTGSLAPIDFCCHKMQPKFFLRRTMSIGLKLGQWCLRTGGSSVLTNLTR